MVIIHNRHYLSYVCYIFVKGNNTIKKNIALYIVGKILS